MMSVVSKIGSHCPQQFMKSRVGHLLDYSQIHHHPCSTLGPVLNYLCISDSLFFWLDSV